MWGEVGFKSWQGREQLIVIRDSKHKATKGKSQKTHLEIVVLAGGTANAKARDEDLPGMSVVKGRCEAGFFISQPPSISIISIVWVLYYRDRTELRCPGGNRKLLPGLISS